MRVSVTGWQRDAAEADPGRFLRGFERLEALGYDGVWLNEFHFQRRGLPYPSPLLLAAAVFARTERLRVGTSVIVLPLHHPLFVAEQVAQLDHQSGGRIDVGIGRGTISRAYDRLGLAVDGDTLRERFEEGYRVLRQAWTQPAVRHRGRFWTLDDVPVGPAPVQQPHPPLFVAGTTPDTIRFAAREGLPLLLAAHPPEDEQLACYRQADGAPEPPGPVLTRHICIAATARAAADQVDHLLPRLRRRRRALAAQRGRPAAGAPLADGDAAERERFLSREAVVGDPATCLAQITALVDETGAAELRCVFNGEGATAAEGAEARAGLFAGEVLPYLRHLRRVRREDEPT